MSFADDCLDRGTDGAGLVQRLQAVCAELNLDELRVLVRYGRLHVVSDRRDFRRESFEELLDAAAYLCMELGR